MNNSKQKDYFYLHHKLYLIIGFLCIINLFFIGLFFGNIFSEKENTKIPVETIDEISAENQTMTKKIPKKIEIPASLNTVTKNLKINRVLTRNNNTYRLSALIENADLLPTNIILEDFSETIKFEKKLNLEDINININTGYLFPPSDKPTVSSYGPGPQDKKKSSIQITILSTNIIKKTPENSLLYELTFKSNTRINEIIIEPTEMRYGKYILQFPPDNVKTS